MSLMKLSASALAITAVCATAAMARDNVQVAGSSTVLPYSTIVAELFGENFDFPTPVVESGGTGGGIKRFCEGVGPNTVDIANASRAIRDAELADCAANGVADVMEVQIGYDGIVFASDIKGPEFGFTPEHWYNALAAEVVQDGKLVANPYKTWNEIDAALPAQAILAYVPGTKHGTREVFEEKMIHAGCKATGAEDLFKAKNGDGKACLALRTDGVSVDIDGDYTETLARVAANPNGIGIFGLAFYENNTDKLRLATISGITPNSDTISDGTYPVSRPLFFYVKKAHIGVIPGLKEFVEFFVSDDIAGAGGPLADYGLVADPELVKVQEAVAAEQTLGK